MVMDILRSTSISLCNPALHNGYLFVNMTDLNVAIRKNREINPSAIAILLHGLENSILLLNGLFLAGYNMDYVIGPEPLHPRWGYPSAWYKNDVLEVGYNPDFLLCDPYDDLLWRAHVLAQHETSSITRAIQNLTNKYRFAFLTCSKASNDIWRLK